MSFKPLLLPVPRRAVWTQDSIPTASLRAIVLRGDPAQLAAPARRLQSAAASAGVNWPLRAASQGERRGAGAVWIHLAPRSGVPAQGYRLRLDRRGVVLLAADAAGVFYGVMTLVQLIRQSPRALPGAVIADHPDFPSRGVMLDISRDKVPTLATLFALVDRLAELKINHLELYTEHTFAYRNHAEVWAQASPMTADDVLALDAYCRERHVELVPNQNSFGHLHRWLELPRYRELAEAPDGFDFPWGGRSRGPFSLNPTHPGSLRLLDEWFDELLPNFTSPKFNVGCDETWDLGQGRNKALCEARGKGRVYLDFLLKIHRLVKRHRRTLHFWGDIILHHPELVSELPRDIVVLEWGYEANHPFAEHAARFGATGVPFYVCPGTSSWSSIAGRTANCLENLRSAAENGIRHGAIGYLNTDWGDGGHWQYLPVSYLGFAAGAAYAWAYAANRDLDVPRALDAHVFGDAAGVLGRLAYDLGNAYSRIGHVRANGSLLSDVLQRPPDVALPKGVTAATIQATRAFIDKTMAPLPAARPSGGDAALVRDEFAQAARMMRHACDRAAWVRDPKGAPAALRRNLAPEMRRILGEHRRLWMARNREGGLHDSARALEARLAEYAGLG